MGKLSKPAYGPNIVRAWFDTVVNPLIRALSRENSFLRRGNWTYRFHNEGFEELDLVHRHLAMDASENLAQFAEFFPDAERLIRTHDGEVERLRDGCRDYLRVIRANAQFREQFHSMEIAAPARLGQDFANHFGAYSSRSDQEAVFAEYLVNSTSALPSHYATHLLWSEYRNRFEGVLEDESVAKAKDHCQQIGGSLLAVSTELVDFLRATRAKLSLEKDVPLVAATSPS